MRVDAQRSTFAGDHVLATVDRAGTVSLHELPAGRRRAITLVGGGVTALAASSDGSRLALARGTEVSVIDAASGRGHESLRLASPVTALALSPDGRVLAAATTDVAISVWTIGQGSPRSFAGHHAPVVALAFSAEGDLLLSGGRDGGRGLWDVGSGELMLRREHAGDVVSVAFTADLAVISAGAGWIEQARLALAHDERTLRAQIRHVRERQAAPNRP